MMKVASAVAVMLFLVVATQSNAQPTSQANGEWVVCPAVGVPTRIEPLLQKGKLLCTYLHATKMDILQSTWVQSTSGAPFKSCLRDNSRYGQTDGNYASRAFCSTTLSQDALNKTAYKWGPWTGDNKKLKRVKLGSTNKSGGQYQLCRVKKSGYRLGHTVGGKCSYWDGKVTRTTSTFDYLLLTKEYGVPNYLPRNKQSTLWLDPSINPPPGFPQDMIARLCTTRIAPDVLDFNGIRGELPGVRVGPACSSNVLGKTFVDKSRLGGDLAGLE